MAGHADAEHALALVDVTKRYGALVALDRASLVVGRGTLHAVLGENGAGKTTLMRIAFGMVRPDAGVVRVGGVVRHFDAPRDAIAAGVGMVHQHFTIVPGMTVAENVALGGRGRYDPRRAADRVHALGEATGLQLDPDMPAGALGVAAQQRLEVLKALARSGAGDHREGRPGTARLLILDEPAAVLAPAEAAELLAWLRGWVDAGGTAVLVTHKLRDALRYADAVTVLRRGATVLHAAVRGASAADPLAADPFAVNSLTEDRLAAAMLGDDVAAAVADATEAARRHVIEGGRRPATDRTVAYLDNVTVVDARRIVRLRNATLRVGAGEIVGVAAVEGSGQHELLRVLAGRLAPSRGHVERPARVAFIPEDRHRDALLLDGSLAENLVLAGAGRRRGVIRWPRVRAATQALMAEADVRGGGPDAPARALSGGNQQKFVVARELAVGADSDRLGDVTWDTSGARVPLVVAENPTRGLDIRASAAVHARLRAAAAGGAGVVVHASDLDEVLELADRVLVVYDGTVREAPRDRAAVGRLMLGFA